jgi:hypothetical protein
MKLIGLILLIVLAMMPAISSKDFDINYGDYKLNFEHPENDSMLHISIKIRFQKISYVGGDLKLIRTEEDFTMVNYNCKDLMGSIKKALKDVKDAGENCFITSESKTGVVVHVPVDENYPEEFNIRPKHALGDIYFSKVKEKSELLFHVWGVS